jgi:hypothetical protein
MLYVAVSLQTHVSLIFVNLLMPSNPNHILFSKLILFLVDGLKCPPLLIVEFFGSKVTKLAIKFAHCLSFQSILSTSRNLCIVFVFSQS